MTTQSASRYTNADLDASGEFDLGEFNASFEKKMASERSKIKKRRENKLNRMNRIIRNKHILDMSIGEVLIKIRNTFFDVFDDLLLLKFQKSTFTKEDRLLYIGIMLIILGILMFSVSQILKKSK